MSKANRAARTGTLRRQLRERVTHLELSLKNLERRVQAIMSSDTDSEFDNNEYGDNS